ncbi:ABC transporter ATP-binding protein/permease [Flavobacteriaceae bacterium]|nr:ABC transporter ATP-binding protein/permease [Flavobacteriaceae bacterium]
MYKKLKELIGIISIVEKRKFYQLQILVFIMTVFQIVSLASFAPFISMISDLDLLDKENKLSDIFIMSGLTKNNFIFCAGFLVILLIGISSFLSIWITWLLHNFSSKLGMSLSARLLKYYLSRNYLFHVANSSSFLMKQVLIEARRVGDGIVTPLIQLISNSLFIVLVIFTLTFYNPRVTFLGGSVLLIVYLLIYIFSKKKIKLNGQNITNKSMLRSKITLNSFGGVRDIIHFEKQYYFVKKFKSASDSFARSQALNTIYSIFPKFLVEFIALGGVVFVLLIFVQPGSDSLTELIPIIVVFGLLLIKLIPAFQAVFGNLAKVKANLPAFDSLYEDFMKMDKSVTDIADDRVFPFIKTLEVKNLHYKYPGERNTVLNGIDFTIEKNSTIGLVGYSGSGKSTLADILVGFLTLKKGEILVDGKALTQKNHRHFKKNVGFVSQSIFLLDASIRENIAFGVDPNEIDDEKLINTIKQASLEDLLKDLPNGIQTEVGERGIQLSGGQVQRIAIARALYTDCEVLIFDEATSALDGITEKYILDSITNLQGTKTIIMIAHRLTTLAGCDAIYVLDKGKVNDVGNFKTLSKTNKIFKKMLKDE